VAVDSAARGAIIRGADIVFAAGAIGVELLEERHWRDERTIELIADCNAQPPFGVGGICAADKGNTRQQKVAFGALGIGGLKLKLHRACVAQLFQVQIKCWTLKRFTPWLKP
jgi:methylenetetrahydrofolate/methylenetetrahydromethanopterin dehydrogenase (NADP+)